MGRGKATCQDVAMVPHARYVLPIIYYICALWCASYMETHTIRKGEYFRKHICFLSCTHCLVSEPLFRIWSTVLYPYDPARTVSRQKMVVGGHWCAVSLPPSPLSWLLGKGLMTIYSSTIEPEKIDNPKKI